MPYAALAVCGLGEVRRKAVQFRASHLISVVHPADRVVRPRRMAGRCHLRIEIDDTANEADDLAPRASHIEEIDGWVDGLEGDSRILVHCLVGISRSTAVTLGILAKVHPPEIAARKLRRLRPEATPNPLIVGLWDAHLRCDGALVAAMNDVFPQPPWLMR